MKHWRLTMSASQQYKLHIGIRINIKILDATFSLNFALIIIIFFLLYLFCAYCVIVWHMCPNGIVVLLCLCFLMSCRTVNFTSMMNEV